MSITLTTGSATSGILATGVPASGVSGSGASGSGPIRLDFGTATPRSRRARGPLVVQLHDELWRITRHDGEVLGYIERFPVRDGERFRAKRFLPRQRRFLVDGEFWSMDDAIECFRAA